MGSGAPQNILSLDSYFAFEQLYMKGLFCNVSVSFREKYEFWRKKLGICYIYMLQLQVIDVVPPIKAVPTKVKYSSSALEL